MFLCILFLFWLGRGFQHIPLYLFVEILDIFQCRNTAMVHERTVDVPASPKSMKRQMLVTIM